MRQRFLVVAPLCMAALLHMLTTEVQGIDDEALAQRDY